MGDVRHASVAIHSSSLRQFRRNAFTHYIVGGALIARFLFFCEGGWVLSLFIPVIVGAIFFWHRRRLPPPLPPPVAACRPFWGDKRVIHTICGPAHAQFAKIHAVGAVWALKYYPSKKLEENKSATPATASAGVGCDERARHVVRYSGHARFLGGNPKCLT